MISLIEFFTFALPKSGMLIRGIPLTVALILFAGWILLHFYTTLAFILRKNALGFSYLVLSIIILLVILLNQTFDTKAAEGILYIISPLTIFIGYKSNKKKSIKIIKIALLVAGIYSILQYVVGIEATTINGITLAFGDSYYNKNIGFGQEGLEALKMPSTYQNGNSVGIFYISSISYLLANRNELENRKKIVVIFNALIMFLGFTGILLSGSRSVVIAFFIACPFLYHGIIKRLKGKRKIAFNILLLSAIIFIVYFIYINSDFRLRLINRYVITTLNDPTASNRTIQWSDFFDSLYNLNMFGIIRFIVWGFPWSNSHDVEGFLYVISYYGFIVFFILIKLMIKPIIISKQINSIYFAGFLGVFIVLCLDRTFSSTPTLMNYFFLAGLILKEYDKQKIIIAE